MNLRSGSALQLGLWRCHACATLNRPASGAGPTTWLCGHCGTVLFARRPDSIGRAWAFLIAATALYIPANLMPVTSTASLLAAQSDTLFSGILFLWDGGSWALAAIVFIASILIPSAKLIVLSYLLLSVQRRSRHARLLRLRLYRVLELVGRWSMLDVFVVTMLAALVRIQSLAQLQPGPGAIAFGAVVVLTMLATRSFDPRLIFDE
ncbi:MAG TPA: paraquat-inducible protein A [Methylibium sp.]